MRNKVINNRGSLKQTVIEKVSVLVNIDFLTTSIIIKITRDQHVNTFTLIGSKLVVMVLRAQRPLGTIAQFFHFVAEEKKKRRQKNKGILWLGYHMYPSKKKKKEDNFYFSWKVTQSRNNYFFYLEFLDGGRWKNHFPVLFSGNTAQLMIFMWLLIFPIK